MLQSRPQIGANRLIRRKVSLAVGLARKQIQTIPPRMFISLVLFADPIIVCFRRVLALSEKRIGNCPGQSIFAASRRLALFPC